MKAEFSPDRRAVTVSVPLAIRRRGGRKQVVAPDGAPAWAPQRIEIDSTLVKALARAFRWRRLLEDGAYASCEELAAAERINASYVSRVLLTLLAPEIVEAILDGRHSPELTMARLFRPFPVEWKRQARALAPR
ncbi:MAG: hypothetical protein H0T75_00190 [Rhizobiales bacterium]|nr:hypothetical protein [Hyphomicrobiales bacterium]